MTQNIKNNPLCSTLPEQGRAIFSKNNIIDIDFPHIWFSDENELDGEITYFLLDFDSRFLIFDLLQTELVNLKSDLFLQLPDLLSNGSHQSIKSIVSRIIKFNYLSSYLENVDSDIHFLVSELRGYGVPSSCFEGIL